MNFIYERISVSLTADYFAEKNKAKRHREKILQISKEKTVNHQSYIQQSYYFKNKSEINTSINKQKQWICC